jgi:hypothetical protein
VSLMEKEMCHKNLQWRAFWVDCYGFVREEQDRGISFAWRMNEITFASYVSCLAKERCIPPFIILKYTWQQWSETEREHLLTFTGWKVSFSGLLNILGANINFIQYWYIHIKFPWFHLVYLCNKHAGTMSIVDLPASNRRTRSPVLNTPTISLI